METIRHGLVLLLVAGVPGLVLFWLVLHAGIRWWRRLGPGVAYLAATIALSAPAAAVVYLRSSLLAADPGPHPVALAAGAGLLGLAVWLRRQLHPHMPFRRLVGWPEIRPGPDPDQPVTSGPYARVRHPRYAQLFVALLGLACLANHPAAYAAVILWLPGAWLVTLLEELELRERYGDRWDQYARRVPRFIPRRHPRTGP